MPPFKQRIDELPSNGLREDLHAGPVAGIGPGGMHHAAGTQDQLRIVAKETTPRKADARIECSVTHSHLGREGLPTVRRLPDEILHLGVKGVVAIIIPTYVHSALARLPYRFLETLGERCLARQLQHFLPLHPTLRALYPV